MWPSKSRKSGSTEPKLLQTHYRGFKIAGESYAALRKEEKRIDREWALRLCNAPDANARARILAEERRMTRFEPMAKVRRTNIAPHVACRDETEAVEQGN